MTKKALYVAIQLQEPNLPKIRRFIFGRDTYDTWTDDCIELMLSPKDLSYRFKFTVNANGARYDEVNWDATLVLPSWNGVSWQVATSQSQDAWFIEAAIPFADLGLSAPKPNESWRALLVRFRWATGNFEGSSWTPTGAFNRPHLFGILRFLKRGEKPFHRNPFERLLQLTAEDYDPKLQPLVSEFLAQGGDAKMKGKIAATLAIALTATSSPIALSQWYPEEGRHDGAYLHEVKTEFITPHITWAKPYARKKLKVFCLTPMSMAPREVVELWQRLDIDFTAATVGMPDRFDRVVGFLGPWAFSVQGSTRAEKEAEILRKLKSPYDVLVIGDVSFDILPPSIQLAILQQVDDGSGLVYVYDPRTKLPLFQKPSDEDGELLFNGLPWSISPSLSVFKDKPDQLLRRFRLGKGRIVQIAWAHYSYPHYGGHAFTPPEPFSPRWHFDYEHYMQALIKAIFWSAPAEKRPNILWVKVAEGFTVKQVEGAKVEFALVNQSQKVFQGILRQVIRNRFNEIVVQSEHPISIGANQTQTLTVSVPANLPAGDYALDLQIVTVSKPASVEQFGSFGFKVEAPFAIAAFLDELKFLDREKATEGIVKFNSPAPENAKFRLSLTDTYGRLFFRHEAVVPKGSQQLKVPISVSEAMAQGILARGELFVRKNLADLVVKHLFAPFRAPTLSGFPTNEFASLIWNGISHGHTGLGVYAFEQARRAGFNLTYGGGETTFGANMTYSLIVTHIGRGADEHGYPTDRNFKGEDASVYNPELLKAYTEPLAKELPKYLPMKPLIYGLGDETYFSYDAGFSPYDKMAFREYVRRRYGSLERLNTEWETQFSSWEEVEPIPYERCRKEGKTAAGIDLRMFNERSYADLHEMLRQLIRKFDPQARTASELGMIGDVPYFFDRVDFFCTTTDRRLHELFRSLPRVKNDPLFLLGDWWGGYVFNHGGRVGAIRLWRQILRGHANSSWFFYIVPSEEGALACDLRLAEYVQEMLPELQEIANGIGQLMANAKIISDGNAIFYSTVNEHVPQFYTAFDGQPTAQGSIIGILDRLGVGYEFVTEDDIAKGALMKGNYRRLFLAGSIAIGDEAAKAITEFVSNGGIVIADLATGIMNGFGRLLSKGQLDELFGIERNGAPKPVTIVIKGSVALNGRKWTTEDLRVLSDASVKPTKAKALMQIDGVPLFVVNEFGKGKVLLCNFTLPGEDHPDAASLMQSILSWAGFELPTSVAEKWLLRRFRLGGLTLLSAIALPGAKEAKVRLSSPAWVYDVRKGKNLGQTSEIALSSKQQAWLFALAPTGKVKISVQAPKSVRCGERLVLKLKLEHQGVEVKGRILRVQIFRPDKSEAIAYRWYPSLSEPQTEISIPIALNDPVGRWSAIVTDVATGTKATTSWEVRR